MACDNCGKVTANTVELVPQLKTPQMACVCLECSDKLNKRLNQLRSRAISAAWRKLRIEMHKGCVPDDRPRRRSPWHRFLGC